MENLFVSRKYKTSKGIIRFLRVVIIFSFCTFAWVFFAANSIKEAFYIIGHFFDNITCPVSYLYSGFLDINMGKGALVKEVFIVLILVLYDFFSLKTDVILEVSKKKAVVRWITYICFGLIIVYFSQKGVAAEFVYFQF